MEATALCVRQEEVLPNVGAHGEGYAPFLLTVFFFILAMNLLGLLPWGATATSNIAVTAAMAIMAFVVIEVTGMRSLGFKGYMKTIFYLPPGLPGGPGGAVLKVLLLLVMTPIEIIGKLAKPFARSPTLRQHDLGARAGAGTSRPDLPVPELLCRDRCVAPGHRRHAARSVRRVSAGVRVHAADRRFHRTLAGGALGR